MNAKSLLKWGAIGAVIAAGIVVLVSGGQPLGHRICYGLVAAGAGFVTAVLCTANFTGDETHGEVN
jgi:hypothetical protein